MIELIINISLFENNMFKFAIFLLIFLLAILLFFYKIFDSIKNILNIKLKKTGKIVIAKNIKCNKNSRRHPVYFTGTILNTKENKIYNIKTEYYMTGILFDIPKFLIVHVDENDYSKYYISLNETVGFLKKLDFTFIKNVFKKYNAFSAETSISKKIIEKEIKIDISWLLKNNIIIEEDEKYYYALEHEKIVIRKNKSEIFKKYYLPVIIILIISVIIALLLIELTVY